MNDLEKLISKTLKTHQLSARNKYCSCGWRQTWPDDRFTAFAVSFTA